MDDLPVVKVINRLEDLFDCLGSIFFCELPLIADTIEQFTASCQLSNDVIFILSWSASRRVKSGRTDS